MFYSKILTKYLPFLSTYTKLEKCLILFFIIHSIIKIVFLYKSVLYMVKMVSKTAYLYLFFYFIILTSFTITILMRTSLHGFIFCFLNLAFIMIYAMLVNNSCGDNKCIYTYKELYNSYVNSFIMHVFFGCGYIILTILLCYHRQWKFIEDIGNTKKDYMNKMYKRYQYQAGLVHINCLTVALWTLLMLLFETVNVSYVLEHYDIKFIAINIIKLDQVIFLIFLLFTLKVIRDESKMIYFLHLLNLLECFLIIYRTVMYCPVNFTKNVTYTICDISYKFRNFLEVQITLATAILTLLITLMQSINLILCHRNFGKNLGFYLKYEGIPPEFEYKDEYSTREKYFNMLI